MEHEVIPPGEIHAPHNWVVADEAARLALSPTETDVRKYLYQEGDKTEWVLTGLDPVEWTQHIGPTGPAGATGATGDTGATGAAGLSAYEVAVSEGFVGTETEWLEFLQGADGDDGREVELQTGATHVQWRYVGEATWTDLVALSAITGPQGIQGIQGDPGPAGGAADIAAETHAATSKATPVDADELGYLNSAAGFDLVKMTWANLKDVLLAYFKGQFREKLTAPRTYYVRTDGSDSNTGLSNTAGGAFATIQKACDVAATLDNGSFDITISVIGTGHAGFVFKSPVGSGNLIVAGSGRTTSSVTTVLCDTPGRFTLRDIAVSNGVTVRPGAALSGSNLNLSSSTQCLRVDGQFLGSGVIEFVGAARHAIYAGGGNCQLVGVDLRVSSAAYAGAFCEAAGLSIINFFSSTVTGSATGKRYIASSNSVIFTGAGPTFLPGDAAGTVDTGGQYA